MGRKFGQPARTIVYKTTKQDYSPWNVFLETISDLIEKNLKFLGNSEGTVCVPFQTVRGHGYIAALML